MGRNLRKRWQSGTVFEKEKTRIFAALIEKTMKKFITVIFTLLVGIGLFAQGKVNTRKYLLSDFTEKVTQVVLTGNEVLDSGLKQEVVNTWTASPFEFCTLDKFETLKTSDKYYFLLSAESRFKDEETPGITFLTLVKGGPEAKDGISAMMDVISLPLTAAAGGSGRELIYLGALIQAVQEFTLAAMDSEKVAYGMEPWFNQNYAKFGKMKQIYLSEDDLSEKVTPKQLERFLDEDIHIVEEAEADKAYTDGGFNTLTSYVVAPFMPQNGASYCYKLLFEADTHTLYYIGKHKITEKTGVGFIADDLKRLARKR